METATPVSSLRWGATPEEWAHFAKLAPGDLLPVVSNPNAELSPQSALHAPGKVPSRYNSRRQVVGFPRWTSYVSSDSDARKWGAEPDYGIGVQCRRIRGIDIDVDAPADALRYAFEIMNMLPASALASGCFYFRRRLNSGRILIPIAAPSVDARFDKRVLKVPEGSIEILGDGQFFVAAGTHSSGQKYQWVRAPIDFVANLA